MRSDIFIIKRSIVESKFLGKQRTRKKTEYQRLPEKRYKIFRGICEYYQT